MQDKDRFSQLLFSAFCFESNVYYFRSSSRVTNFIVALLVILRIKMFCYGQFPLFFLACFSFCGWSLNWLDRMCVS